MDPDADLPRPVPPEPAGSAQSFVVVLGGGPVSTALTSTSPGAVVIAADSGLESAVACGRTVHHVVGDFDSVDAEVLAAAVATGTQAHRHPADKDATDSELAYRLVARSAPAHSDVQVFTTVAGRFDHLLSDVLAMAGPTLADLDVTGHVGDVVVTVVRPGRPRTINGTVDEQVSLIPAHGSVDGVSTFGLRWPLVVARLTAGTSRGVSNSLAAGSATVSIDEGVLVVVQPGAMAPPVASRTTSYDPTPR